jgi:hypothetical protein
VGSDQPGANSVYQQIGQHNAMALESFALTISSAITQYATGTISQSLLYIAGAAIFERVKINDTSATGAIYVASASELTKISGLVYAAANAAVREGATVHDFANALAAVFMLERVKASGAPLTNVTYHMFAVEAASAVTAFMALANLNMLQNATVTASIAKQYITVASLLQNLSIQDVSSVAMKFCLTLTEHAELDDDQLLTMIFNGTLTENVIGTIQYASPSGNVSTWVVNTRTNAITEYGNWSFNSFASMGLKYIAADENGLYELNGERDLTANIVADIAGGMVQFNGAKFAGLKGVYIGMKGQGEYLLKLVAGDMREYVYQFDTNPGRMTTKVRIGKGLRSRYFQWELISTGPDFDLDTVEFVPMVSDRRV